MAKAVVLMSGGLDSCVTAACAKRDGYELMALHISYHQRTENREETAFHRICDYYEVQERFVGSIDHLARIGGSCLTDPNIAVEEADLNRTEMPNSYVPFRNAHLLSVAVSWAEVEGADRIYIGAVAEDSSGYPDCRPEYYAAFNEVIRLGTHQGHIRIETPIIHLRKRDIVRLGIELGVPIHLTWSCYQNEEVACGRCDSCALRLRGFAEAGMSDPIPYVR
ncbi:MAG: 7-cyano-7-deazaguanine synthase QueC [Armatimonadetes bacterium]|nr:7-cyano-7-deazaguanine synthase QueC [Armatimonadota bacterium]